MNRLSGQRAETDHGDALGRCGPRGYERRPERIRERLREPPPFASPIGGGRAPSPRRGVREANDGGLSVEAGLSSAKGSSSRAVTILAREWPTTSG